MKAVFVENLLNEVDKAYILNREHKSRLPIKVYIENAYSKGSHLYPEKDF